MMVSRCSSRYVQLKPGKNINAKGNRRSLYAVLKFESDPSGAGYVRIQGDTSNRYLCFSKKARLIARSIGDSDQCLFKEEYHGHFVKLQSVVQPQWYVGFNSRGRKLYGYEHDFPRRRDRFGRKFRRRRHQNCFMFTKVDVHRRRRNRSRRHFRGRSLEVSKRRRTFKSSKNR